jgi:putative membrane protein
MARRHRAALTAGTVLVIAAFMPPVAGLADQRLSLRMLEEMLMLAIVVPLLAYGLHPLLSGRFTSWLSPLIGILALNLVLFGSQVPMVLDLATKNLGVREVLQGGFVLGAFVFWWPIVGRNQLTPIAKIGYLMVAGVPPTIPGITLAFSHHLFYQAYRSIEDQQLAGLLLFATAKFALVTGTLVLLWRLLTPEPDPPDRDDRDSPAGDLPPPAPDWLSRLDEDLPIEVDRPRRPVPLRG